MRRAALIPLVIWFVAVTSTTSSAADFYDVTMIDSSSAPGAFNPPKITIPQGNYISWTNQSSKNHTSTGNSPLNFWDTGPITPPASVDRFFKAAGSYPYHCSIHPTMKGVVRVPIERAPSSGAVGTRFTIKVASEAPSASFVYDIQKRVGKNGTWKAWRTLGTANTTTFKPGAAGTYFFRGRIRDTSKDPDATSGWSPARSVSAT